MSSHRYAVFGHPVAHSLSPRIHAAFAQQTGIVLEYTAIDAAPHDFVAALDRFADDSGAGANVTLPLKEAAFAICAQTTDRARRAGAVNTLTRNEGQWHGDNTDGAGLVRDLTANLDFALAGRRILLLGAGGATRGVLLPLLDSRPTRLTIANRTVAKAEALSTLFAARAGDCVLDACGFDALAGRRFDLVINATAASLADELPPLPPGLYAEGALAYDMMYARAPTRFMRAALADGAARVADGLGMLVEQAAESFTLWRGVRPDSAPVLAALRRQLDAG